MKNDELKELASKMKAAGVNMSDDQVAQLAEQIKKDFSYIPKIGIFGKTGAGKSSLVNSIFGQDVCPVSDVEACTREIQEANVGGMILVDCPGIAESKERDEEYHKLYSELIPKMDAIIWVLQGDNRSYGPDIEFYELLRECFKTKEGQNAPIYFALNQVDKIEPYREWNVNLCQPGTTQAKNIQAKIDNVASIFHTASNMVIPVSAVEKYNLSALITAVLNSLPANQAIIVSNNINEAWQKRYEEQLAIIEQLKRENAEAARIREERLKEESEAIHTVETTIKKGYEKGLLGKIGKYVDKGLNVLDTVSDYVPGAPGKVLKTVSKGLKAIRNFFS